MQEYCGNCGAKLEEEVKFCPNCGSLVGQATEVDINQHFAANNDVSKKDHKTYKLIVGIVMIILGSLILLVGLDDIAGGLFVYVLPGGLALAGGILSISSRNNHSLLKISGILLLVGAGVNFIGIFDISPFAIISVVLGIISLVFSK